MEDDGAVDYPYDYDQHGYHLFGQFDLTRRWKLAVGQHRVDEVAGGGRNHSSYAILTFRREEVAMIRRIFLENHLRRVRDDISDEYVVVDEIPIRQGQFGQLGLTFYYEKHDGSLPPPRFVQRFRRDPVWYSDSYVNESYAEARVRPVPNLELTQTLRARFNWQQGGRLYNGQYQRSRRLDFWSWVGSVDYEHHWGRATIRPQYKFMLLRLVDQERNLSFSSETRSIPILRFSMRVVSRTVLQAGVQGFGPLPYRHDDRIAKRNSFEQRTSFVTLTNRSAYFGYELVTIFGVGKDEKKLKGEFQDHRAFHDLTLFARAIIGFTEYGRLI